MLLLSWLLWPLHLNVFTFIIMPLSTLYPYRHCLVSSFTSSVHLRGPVRLSLTLSAQAQPHATSRDGESRPKRD